MLFNHGVGEDSWESLGLQRNQRSNPKGNQSWIFIGRIDVEAETPILWPPDAKNWFIGKNPDAGKDWGQEEKGMTRGWDGWMAPLTWWTWVWANSRSWCCSPWGHKELDMTERLNWTEKLRTLNAKVDRRLNYRFLGVRQLHFTYHWFSKLN